MYGGGVEDVHDAGLNGAGEGSAFAGDDEGVDGLGYGGEVGGRFYGCVDCVAVGGELECCGEADTCREEEEVLVFAALCNGVE